MSNNGRGRGGRLTPRIERAILKSFGRAGLSSRWWLDFRKELRYCLRCGGGLEWRFVEAESRERFACRACSFIVYQNPKIVAATLPVWRGKIILLRRAIEPARGLWSYPAGFMELGETVEEAAVRETREEIGARVKIRGLPRIYSYSDAAVVTLVFLAEAEGAAPRPGLESLEVRAFARTEIPWRELAFRSTFQALRDWAAGEFREGGEKRGGKRTAAKKGRG
jgi:ADP-ribose pyrophosphatase YjhB (NUDIX family)